MSEQDERRVYSLSDDHDFAWADMDDLVPKAPGVPKELQPLFPTGETVDEVDHLSIYAFGDDAPYFPNSPAAEATPQEMAEWRTTWASIEEAQQAFRQRLEWARRAYEAAARDALADLAEAMKPWEPVEAKLKGRTAELAAKLHAHRAAAKEWKAKKEAEEQEQLDAIHGPRAIVLYRPKSLNSLNTADHVAKVHLVDCKRRAKLSVPIGHARHADEGLRAGEAWHRLTNPGEWTRTLWGEQAANLRVKFCSFCKPWTVFEEHIEDFPRPRYSARGGMSLGEIRLVDAPEAWTDRDS